MDAFLEIIDRFSLRQGERDLVSLLDDVHVFGGLIHLVFLFRDVSS